MIWQEGKIGLEEGALQPLKLLKTSKKRIVHSIQEVQDSNIEMDEISV